MNNIIHEFHWTKIRLGIFQDKETPSISEKLVLKTAPKTAEAILRDKAQESDQVKTQTRQQVLDWAGSENFIKNWLTNSGKEIHRAMKMSDPEKADERFKAFLDSGIVGAKVGPYGTLIPSVVYGVVPNKDGTLTKETWYVGSADGSLSGEYPTTVTQKQWDAFKSAKLKTGTFFVAQ